ncbi:MULTISPECIES: hypothetical protein [Streptomyces]|uniref:Uncharacterized protein n=2 Tax=Streptomyces rimosus subsp. rimosus TaxID=132474 RepID=L8EEC0_STRR1|nr:MULTISPECIES: hypothetical protein [Streptomyces]KOG67369.1 hypothetical protein ADK78_40955 [Kitasatospora aureofaciens]MYT46969.1 hypothetical protein [Streptomyces sp. SID5471]KOT43718.1 hypothetical protein ADK42_07445 [Streptomyces rimosus subsp. rimosus]KOT44921.1 hypothetical protein ADK84_05980 [Streptomyces sp. NRRL WC-3701]KOT64484.1 hypothetical protein ADK44_09205 [Streptomyces rimosus subsp. rimosus]
MTAPTAPAEKLLLLGGDFARQHDYLSCLRLDGLSPATALTQQSIPTQDLARLALDIVEGLDAQRMYHSPEIRTVYARVRQLAHLAIDTADHLLDAEDILDDTYAGVPAKGEGPLLTYRQALETANSRLILVRKLTAPAPQDTLTAAELFVTERRRRGEIPPQQPPAFSPAQYTALRAVARGEVTIADDKPYLHRDDWRIALSTLRSLEDRGLVAREKCPLWLHDERVHLSADGRRDLIATFGRPPAPARTAARPAPAPKATPSRSL